jgi:ketosteroid isomerase-like protein
MADTDDPTATVQRMFAAFGAGDLDVLLETVHPDSRWTYFGANPRLTRAEFVGRAEVRKFFEGILKRLEITAFNTEEFIVQGDTVVIFGNESGKVRATGQPFRHEWSQKYVVRDNQITSMAEYNIQVEPRN